MKNINNTDFGFAGLSIARIARQLKKDFFISSSMYMSGVDEKDYILISIHSRENNECIYVETSSNYESMRDFCDTIFARCMENDLFEIPLNLKMVD